MTHGVTRVLVESVVASLNEKAERLGWSRRYRFVKGNNAMGQQHVLETDLPHLVHPAHREPIGNTLNKAHKYLCAMGQVLNDALLERASARAGVMTGTSSPAEHRTLGIYDPDARANRPGEE